MTKYRVVTRLGSYGQETYTVQDNYLFGFWTDYDRLYSNLSSEREAIGKVNMLVAEQERKRKFKSKVVYGPLP